MAVVVNAGGLRRRQGRKAGKATAASSASRRITKTQFRRFGADLKMRVGRR